MQIQAIMTRACNFVQSSLYTEDWQLSSLRGKGHVRTQSCALTPCHLSSKKLDKFHSTARNMPANDAKDQNDSEILMSKSTQHSQGAARSHIHFTSFLFIE